MLVNQCDNLSNYNVNMISNLIDYDIYQQIVSGYEVSDTIYFVISADIGDDIVDRGY